MKHNLKIRVSKKPSMDGIIACKSFTFREKILHFLFGNKKRMMVLIPGENVDEIVISENEKGEKKNGQEESDS
jgi:hypothetical protein